MHHVVLVLLFAVALGAPASVYAQELPQSTAPAPSPERQREIRDSIRNRGRFRVLDDEADERARRYEADRALLMPRMERTSVFRIGLPGWLMRAGLSAGRAEFDTDEEYRAARRLLRRIRALRVAVYVDNAAYSQAQLLGDYARFIKRKRGEPVMVVRAPAGGVQIHVKERRGKVKLISLVAYGAEGAAVVRLKSKIRAKDLQLALKLMAEAAEETAGVEIDASE